MEKSLKLKRRSQLTMAVIVLAALIGVLAINTDRASAVKADAKVENTAVQIETAATTNTGSPTAFYSSAAPSLLEYVPALPRSIPIGCLGRCGSGRSTREAIAATCS